MARGLAQGGRTGGRAGSSGTAKTTGAKTGTSPRLYNGRSVTLPPPAPRPAPTPAPQRTAQPSTGSNLGTTSTGQYGGYSGGGGFGAGALTQTVAPTTAPVTQPERKSLEDWLKSDSVYTAQIAALDAALKRFGQEVGQFDDKGNWVGGYQQQTYDKDYERNLRDLGWDAENKAWNQNDRMTSYGSAYGNQLDDFAARGMMESSAYAEALNNLLRGFDDQRNNMGTARDSFIKGLQEQFRTADSDFKSQRTMAETEAAMRRAAEYGL